MPWIVIAGGLLLGSLPAQAFGSGSPQQERSAESVVVIEGRVHEPDGTPASGAVVACSAGGTAIADPYGSFRLETRVPLAAETIRITASGAGSGERETSTRLSVPATGFASIGVLRLASCPSCVPSWHPTFGAEPGVDERVHALAAFDDGSGPRIYAGGRFSNAGGQPAKLLAVRDGSAWTPLSSQIDTGTGVWALESFDDGSGLALYVGGVFSSAGGVTVNNLARWDGTSWTALGSGLDSSVLALAVHDDGGGPALHAAGQFVTASGVPAARVARWDGTTWSPLGAGIGAFGDVVVALASFDDGSGPKLYAAGEFSTAGGQAARNIARWDGSSWSEIPAPQPCPGNGCGVGGRVNALEVFDDGGGPKLYAAGEFTLAGGVTVNHVARWDGTNWSALGSGTNGTVLALAVFDDGSGPALHAGGEFLTAGGVAVSRAARWDGSAWSALGGGANHWVYALETLDDGGGPALFAGGLFTAAGGASAHHVACWDGSAWSGPSGGATDTVRALAEFDDGAGPALYAGGSFKGIGDVAANLVARWDGSGWAALGAGLEVAQAFLTEVRALASFDDGLGPALYVGGRFGTAGGGAANNVARWDGSSWAPLGTGVTASLSADVRALAVFDDGGGPALYAGGSFTAAGGLPANRIARWDGSSWASLGSGTSSVVSALVVHDDGGGPALFAGGAFVLAGGSPANHVARWNGSSWSPLASGLANPVTALAVYDDGGGPALFAGDSISGAGTARLWKWNGSSWSQVGTAGTEISALAVHDDGGGTMLYAGGTFTTAAGVAANRIARWDGVSWNALGAGMSGPVLALLPFGGGGGPALYAGGEFRSNLDSGDARLARWGCVPDVTPPTLHCPPFVLVGDRIGSPAGEVVHFTVTAVDERDPAPCVVCVPPSGSVFPRGRTLVTCTATDDTGNVATCVFPVIVAAGTKAP